LVISGAPDEIIKTIGSVQFDGPGDPPWLQLFGFAPP
jgi:hypothetical protein